MAVGREGGHAPASGSRPPLNHAPCRSQLRVNNTSKRPNAKRLGYQLCCRAGKVSGAQLDSERQQDATRNAAAPSQLEPAGPAPQRPNRSRLKQEVELMVALDVEYAHLALLPGDRHISLPAEVCAVDARGAVLLYEHCNPLEGDLEHVRWRHVGGAPPALWQYAPPLSEVRSRLAALLEGRILVGHHLTKDLKALALDHPQDRLRDTLRYRELQGRGGLGRKLRTLSAEKLGRKIQQSGRRHSPREDAQAAMDLYLQEVHFGTHHMGYEDLVSHYLEQILEGQGQGSGGGGGP